MKRARQIKGSRTLIRRFAWLKASGPLIGALLLVVLAARWFVAERTLVRVEATLEQRSGELSLIEWEGLQGELDYALSLRPASVPARVLQNRLWDERRLVENALPADAEDPLAAWFALQERVGEEGVAALREATRLHPASPRAWAALALRKLQVGEADAELRHALDQLHRYGFSNDEARRNMTLMTATYTVEFIVDDALLNLMLDHYYSVLAPGQHSVAAHMTLLNNSGNAGVVCGYLEPERLAEAAQRVCARAQR